MKSEGNEEEVKKAVDFCRMLIKENPEDKPIIEAYLSLIKERGEREKVTKEAVEYAISWLESHPDDNKIRLITLNLVRVKGFFVEYIRPVLNDAEEWMKKHGPHPLFGSYMKLIEKVMKTETDVPVNFERVRHLCYSFIASSEGKKNISPIINFAELLWGKGAHEEAEKIYRGLLEIKANPLTMSTIYLSYGKRFLGDAMDPQLTQQKRMEKLEKAERIIEGALEFHKGHYIAHMFLSIVLKEKGNEDEQRKELKEAERWNRIAKKERFSAGEIPYKVGNFYLGFDCYEEAVRWFKIAIETNPRNFVNWWKLGDAKKRKAIIQKEAGLYVESKKLFKEAISDLETALKEAPEFLQLPASRDIPANIEECKRELNS